MWFTEYSNNTLAKIGRITTSGVLTEYALPNPARAPTAIAAGPDGALWFIESATTNIGRITTSGAITEFPLPAAVLNFGVYGITAGPDGNLWFTQYYGYNGILRMTTAGVFTAYPISTTVNIGSYGITAGPDGALWFADSGGTYVGSPPGKIGRITTSGTITEYPLPQAGDLPYAIAAGPDGALWFTDYLGQIGRITTSGTVTSEVPTPTNTAGGYLGFGPDSIAAGPDGAMWFIEVEGKIGRIPTGVTVTPPVISAVENGASFLAGGVTNSWVTIKGTNVSPVTDNWNNSIVNGVLPISLDGVSVSMGGKPAYIYYIAPGQLNVLAPDISPGPVSVTVMTPSGTSPAVTATITLYGPAFFEWPGSQVVATRQDYSYAVAAGTFAGLTTVPAAPGDVLILWATGFGPTNPPAPDGVAVPSTQSYATLAAPTVTIDSIPAVVYGAALASGSVGLYQIAIQVPLTLANGTWPIQAMIGGVSSPTGIVLTVHQ